MLAADDAELAEASGSDSAAVLPVGAATVEHLAAVAAAGSLVLRAAVQDGSHLEVLAAAIADHPAYRAAAVQACFPLEALTLLGLVAVAQDCWRLCGHLLAWRSGQCSLRQCSAPQTVAHHHHLRT